MHVASIISILSNAVIFPPFESDNFEVLPVLKCVSGLTTAIAPQTVAPPDAPTLRDVARLVFHLREELCVGWRGDSGVCPVAPPARCPGWHPEHDVRLDARRNPTAGLDVAFGAHWYRGALLRSALSGLTRVALVGRASGDDLPVLLRTRKAVTTAPNVLHIRSITHRDDDARSQLRADSWEPLAIGIP